MTYKDGVTVLIHTLNDEENIEECLCSILKSNPSQLIVADGTSDDNTVKISKELGAEVYITEPGFHKQQREAFKHVQYKYLIIIEADQRYPECFINNMVNEFNAIKVDGLQATLKCVNKRNFWERGISRFYEIHSMKKGQRDIIGGPAIYLSDVHINNLSHGAVGFAGDTMKAEQAKKLNLKFALGETVAFQKQSLNYETFKKKYMGYGKGDCHFYQYHSREWKVARKIKSITHVARRYFFTYPLISLKMRDIEGALFLTLSGLYRYLGWIREFFIIKK